MVEEIESMESRSSCEITISTKGVFSGKIKEYATNAHEAREAVIAEAELLQKYLNLKNGVLLGGGDGAE